MLFALIVFLKIFFMVFQILVLTFVVHSGFKVYICIYGFLNPNSMDYVISKVKGDRG